MSSVSASASLGERAGPEARRTTLILVTGSRTWTNPVPIWSRLDDLQADLGHLTIIHGACPSGVDLIAHVWTQEQVRINPMAIREWPFPADWKNFGRQAGLLRNDEMVRLGADYCLAWIDPCTKFDCRRPKPHGSHGASDCVERARVWKVPHIELVESWAKETVPDPNLV